MNNADTLAHLQDQVLAAAASNATLRIKGGGSKAFYGVPAQGAVLDVTQHSGIVSYEPTELVITARCGTPLAQIEALLADNNQSLAFEPPNFNGAASFGGMVAAGLSGPARASAGSARDYVLGAQLLDGRGQVLNFGGQVMKNVAGYDVSRLLTGSLGLLGVVTQASVKVWPVAKATAYACFDLALADAIVQMNRWGGQALPITATCWHEGVLTVRLAGAAAAVDAALRSMGGQPCDGAALFGSLRHQSHAFFAPQAGQVLMRVSLPSVAPPLGVGGPALIEWGGAQRWVHVAADAIASTRALAQAAGGHATVWRNADAAAAAQPVFTPLDAVSSAVHTRLKAEYDPQGVFVNCLF